MNKRVELKIFGLVQGINYRWSSQKEAKRRNLFGFVRNLSDETVQIVIEGQEEDLKNFIHWCYNGVATARVDKIEASWSQATGEFTDFLIQF